MLGVSFEVNMFSKTVHIEEIKECLGPPKLGHYPCLTLLLALWPLQWIEFWTLNKGFWPLCFHFFFFFVQQELYSSSLLHAILWLCYGLCGLCFLQWWALKLPNFSYYVGEYEHCCWRMGITIADAKVYRGLPVDVAPQAFDVVFLLHSPPNTVALHAHRHLAMLF